MLVETAANCKVRAANLWLISHALVITGWFLKNAGNQKSPDGPTKAKGVPSSADDVFSILLAALSFARAHPITGIPRLRSVG
jgi:hypothetical protein